MIRVSSSRTSLKRRNVAQQVIDTSFSHKLFSCLAVEGRKLLVAIPQERALYITGYTDCSLDDSAAFLRKCSQTF